MTIRRLKLWHYPATRSARVRWLLHELVDDDFDLVRLDLYGGGQYEPEYLAVNPNHNVPLLEITRDDGSVQRMIESGAMVAFLADAYPEKGLAPAPGDSAARADYLQVLHFASTWMDMMLWQVRVHEHVLDPAEKDDRTIARYRRKFVEEAEPQIAARLEKGPYVCGERFTAADCLVGHNLFWGSGYGMCRRDVFRRYLALLHERPAFAKAFSDLGDFTVEAPQGARLSRLFTG